MPGGYHPITGERVNPWTGQTYLKGRVRIIPLLLTYFASHKDLRNTVLPLILAQDVAFSAYFEDYYKKILYPKQKNLVNPFK